MLYENKGIVTDGQSFLVVKEQAHINTAARAADTSPEFSKLIRQGRIGFDGDAQFRSREAKQ